MVRAKFQVIKVAKLHRGQTEITMSAVYADEVEENRRFHKYTPSGQIQIMVDNPPASDQLVLGDYFYVDFSPVPKPVSA